MAFYDPEQDEDSQSQNAPAGTQVSSDSSVITGNGGQTAGQGSGAPAAQAAPKTNSPDRPGNFVNLQDYINANQPQAQKLGDQASGVINSSVDAANQGVGAFNQDASQNIKPTSYLSDDVATTLKNDAENLTPDQKQTIKNTQTATYTGPQSYNDLQSYQNAADTTSKAVQDVNNAGTEQGRMDIISQINNKPRTQGENVFDNALLSAGGGSQKIQDTANANKNLQSNLDTATQAVTSQIGRADDPTTANVDESTGAIGQTNKAQADAAKQVQDALAAWTAGFNPKVTQAQQNLVDSQNGLISDITQNPLDLSDADMQALGLTRGTRLFNNTDLGQYITQTSPSDINAANVATPEDYARYAALADLAGDTSNYLDPANASQAGTAPNTAQINTAKLQQDLQQAQNNYNQAYVTSGSLAPFISSLTDVGDIGANLAGTYGSYTPQEIETKIIPTLLGPGPNDPTDYTKTQAYRNEVASSLQNALDQWRTNLGYNNIESGYGLNGTSTSPTSVPGHIINRI